MATKVPVVTRVPMATIVPMATKVTMVSKLQWQPKVQIELAVWLHMKYGLVCCLSAFSCYWLEEAESPGSTLQQFCSNLVPNHAIYAPRSLPTVCIVCDKQDRRYSDPKARNG